jgi:hypothetical protein
MRDFTAPRLRGHLAFGLCAKAQASTAILSTAEFSPKSLDLNRFFSIPADLGPMPAKPANGW